MWCLGGRYTHCRLLQRYCAGWAGVLTDIPVWDWQNLLEQWGSSSRENVWECVQMWWGSSQLEWKDLFLHWYPSALPASWAPPACGSHATCGVHSTAFMPFLPRSSLELVESKQASFPDNWVFDICVMLHMRRHYFLLLYRMIGLGNTPSKGLRGTSALQIWFSIYFSSFRKYILKNLQAK